MTKKQIKQLQQEIWSDLEIPCKGVLLRHNKFIQKNNTLFTENEVCNCYGFKVKIKLLIGYGGRRGTSPRQMNYIVEILESSTISYPFSSREIIRYGLNRSKQYRQVLDCQLHKL